MRVEGFVHDIRILSNVIFVIIRNRGGFVQLTIKKDSPLFETAQKLKRESVVIAEGEFLPKPIAKIGKEMIPNSIKIVTEPFDKIPVDILERTETSLSVRLDWRPLDLRIPKNRKIFEIESLVLRFAEEYFHKKGFIQVFTPSIIGGISEGGADVFEINYFGKKASLRQDPQLHRQLLMLAGFEKIFEIGPSWRAEKSHTFRHLCEHRNIAAEISFIKNEYDVMKVEEGLIKYITKRIKDAAGEDIKSEFGVEINVPSKIPVVEFPQVYSIIKDSGIEIKEGEEPNANGELAIGNYAKEKFGTDFVFVNKFPFAVKPFYVMKDNETYARSTDLLFKGVEISSGGQREHRYEKIKEQISEKGLNPENFKWFTDHFKYGAPTHGGFSIGLERFVMLLLGLQNVREAVAFPRDPERLLP